MIPFEHSVFQFVPLANWPVLARRLAIIRRAMIEPLFGVSVWSWVLLAGAVACVLAGTSVHLLRRRRQQKRRTWTSFTDRAEALGLCAEERSLLVNIAGAAGLGRCQMDAVFNDEDAFNRGLGER